MGRTRTSKTISACCWPMLLNVHTILVLGPLVCLTADLQLVTALLHAHMGKTGPVQEEMNKRLWTRCMEPANGLRTRSSRQPPAPQQRQPLRTTPHSLMEIFVRFCALQVIPPFGSSDSGSLPHGRDAFVFSRPSWDITLPPPPPLTQNSNDPLHLFTVLMVH